MQLRGNAHALARPAYAPLQEVRHPKLPSDLGEAGRLAAKGEGRVASDDEERTEARKAGDDVFGDAVAEVGLLGLATQIVERKHGDRWSIRKRLTGRFGCLRLRPLPDVDGAGDILQRLFAGIPPRQIQLACYVFMDAPRDRYPSWLSQRLKPCRHIDAITVDVFTVGDDLALIDADAEFQATRLGSVHVAVCEQLLDCGSAADRANHASELGQNTVACRVDDAAAMVLDDWEDGCLVVLERTNGCLLVLAHQTAVAGNVGCKYGG